MRYRTIGGKITRPAKHEDLQDVPFCSTKIVANTSGDILPHLGCFIPEYALFLLDPICFAALEARQTLSST